MITLIEKVYEENLVKKEKANKNILDKYLISSIPNEKWISVEEKNTRNPDYVKRCYTILPMELANFIRNNLNYFFVRGEAMEAPLIYVYMDGAYRNVSDTEFKGFIKSFIPYQLRKTRDVNEVYTDLTTDLKFIDYESLNDDENIINFQDGILNLDTMKLMPHSPKILSTVQIPANYRDVENTDIKAPVFEKYMMTLIDENAELYVLLMQCLGLIISNVKCYRTKKSLMLFGAGNTGKSQLKRLAETLVGDKNINTIDLKELNERFGTASLYQKRLVGCNDMSFQRIADMSIFKQITGGDKIKVEFKNKTSFSYLYKGFLWFNCNKMPLFGGDDGKWVYDRIMPVHCKNVIPDDKKDPNLFEKMWEEKDAIIRQAIFFLNQLRNNNYRFDEPAALQESRKIYEIENNTLLSFVDECCFVCTQSIPSKKLKKSEFKKAYYRWCDMNGLTKGKLRPREIERTLAEHYGTKISVIDGYDMIDNILIEKQAREELGIDYY